MLEDSVFDVEEVFLINSYVAFFVEAFDCTLGFLLAVNIREFTESNSLGGLVFPSKLRGFECCGIDEIKHADVVLGEGVSGVAVVRQQACDMLCT